MEATASVMADPRADTAREPWINGRRWDLLWLVASAAVVPLGLLIVHSGASPDLINLGVTILVGGPHLFATYLATYMDPRFRRSHLWVLAAATVLVPAFVITMTVWNFQILLSVFMFAASAHVLQQNAFIAGVYRNRAGRVDPFWSRFIDYGALGLSFYPVAAYKLARHDFRLGGVEILIPEFARAPLTWIVISALFGGFMLVWGMKTFLEYRRGVMNGPKTLLIGFTCPIAFFIPLAATGERLELAFQTVNLWHSIQYLALVWFILKLRKERGLMSSGFLKRISGSGTPSILFYGLCIAVTFGMLGAIAVLTVSDPLDLRPMQYYYMGVLSSLLIHYALDGYLFTVSNRRRASQTDNPFAALSKREAPEIV